MDQTAYTLGLANLGNTCGINTWLQCVFASPTLVNTLVHKEKQYKENGLGIVMKNIINTWKKERNANKAIVPRELVKYIYRSSGGLFEPNEELDIGELWQWMLYHLHEEIAVPWNLDENVIDPMKLNAEVKVVYDIHRHCEGKRSDLLDTVQAVQLSFVKCQKCGFIVHNVEPSVINSLAIPIKPDHNAILQKPIVLSELFNLSFTKEIAHGWSCDKCKEQDAIRTTRFWSLPQVLVIAFKRFVMAANGQIHKDHTPIDIPDTITFHKGTILSCNEEKTYSLRSVALHVGSYQGGHYGAIVRHKNKWFLCDDERVEEIPDISIVNTGNTKAYVVVYECCS